MTISLSAGDAPVHGGVSHGQRECLPVHLHPVKESHRLGYVLPLTIDRVGFEPVFKGLEHSSELCTVFKD